MLISMIMFSFFSKSIAYRFFPDSPAIDSDVRHMCIHHKIKSLISSYLIRIRNTDDCKNLVIQQNSSNTDLINCIPGRIPLVIPGRIPLVRSICLIVFMLLPSLTLPSISIIKNYLRAGKCSASNPVNNIF